MKKSIFVAVSSLILSYPVLAQGYQFDKLSVGKSHYSFDSETSANGFDLDYRGISGDILYQASYSNLELFDVDVDMYNISAGYALSNTKKRLTAVGVSFGRASVLGVDVDYQALNLIHSYQATDSVEFNSRLTRVFADDSDNYFEAELGFSYKFTDNFGIYVKTAHTDESERIWSAGAEISF